jgi:tetraacyldisaccharide-1-P 4'-kinase
VATFSGVGTPRSFQLLLANSLIKPVRNFEFEDHHIFTENELRDIKRVSEAASADEIITTEKDFYRSPELITRVLNPLILAARLRISVGEEVLTERLFRLLGVTRV